MKFGKATSLSEEIHVTPNNTYLFWKKVEKTDGCWNWTAAKDKWGYGYFGISGKIYKAHRLSFYFHKGLIPEGFCVCHSCDNPSCMNPDHLWLGLQKENIEDMLVKGRKISASGNRNGSRTQPERLSRGEINKNSKLKTSQVLEIDELLKIQKPLKEIGALYGVTGATISAIRDGLTWRHVTGRKPASELTLEQELGVSTHPPTHPEEL